MPKNSLAKEAREVLILLVDSIQSLTLDEYTLRNPFLAKAALANIPAILSSYFRPWY